MLTIMSLLILFCTAALAGFKCMTRGYRVRGWIAFALLETGYLLVWNRHWIIGALLMALGAWVVFHCMALPDRSVVQTGDANSPIVSDQK